MIAHSAVRAPVSKQTGKVSRRSARNAASEGVVYASGVSHERHTSDILAQVTSRIGVGKYKKG